MKKSSRLLLYLFFCLSILHAPAQDSEQNGKASFYHDSFHGQETSNGESYNKSDFTAAHRTLPFGTILLVTNKKNKKSAIVRINDRGPFKKSRVIDVSYASAVKLGMVPFGVVQVRITPLTYLDASTLDDTDFVEGEIRDCYGNKQKLSGKTLLIWKTENWKHAFYMASNLSLENNTEIFVMVKGAIKSRKHFLVITGLDETKLMSLKKTYEKAGFNTSRFSEE